MSATTENSPAAVVQALSYEEALAQLETILTTLEQDDLPLETALTLYEQGVVLADYCTNLLDTAELRVRKWQADGQTVPFDNWQEG
ncbi:MAG: exodeoxyribonuclease VII small subunit [Caldilineaceae bacterium]|nr:exodeoxyribonuclease VII small subunit [Caldilineaceae bacterium]